MLLQSLRLKNIRSYTDERIDFPQGIVLLAGDIGAGKSTILLAIEFALFGLLRGDLSGAALLRNGAREGLVELAFEIDGKPTMIGRTLKRSKTSVEQDAGYLIEDGLRREATAIELKTAVLGLLGYPADLITKSKSLIYRYTVYTPQEEMKKIILEDTESRLMILRKVFDIEKYRRINDNAATYAKLLRERKRTYEGQLVDEPLKQQQSQAKQQDAHAVQQALLAIQPQFNAAKQAVIAQKAQLDTLETERAALNQHRAAFQAAEAELATLSKQRASLQDELAPFAAQATAPPTPPSLQHITQAIQQKQQEVNRADALARMHIAAHAELKATKHLSEATAQKILALDQCPTCLQKVDATHKHQFTQSEQQKLQSLLAQLAVAEAAVSTHEQDKQRLTQEIATLQQQQALAHAAQLQFQRYQLNQQRKLQIETTLTQLAQSITAAEQRKREATALAQASGTLEQRFLAEKQKLEAALQYDQQIVVQHTRLLENAKHLRDTLTLLEQELAAKREARITLEKLNALHHWLDEFFTGLMGTMEKHVLTKVYHDFNGLFQQWFGLLIQDDVLVARLNQEFSPVVQQNGYDTDVTSLSGGEKTACALAYRLALNKVINELRTGIHTKDLIILDEPTDGFSADQLDRMREVLEQVQARQIIIVSHEAKIESLADHVLRVVKEEHTSKVLV